MLSTAAFNALLKTLEEPPSHVVFVLATTDPQKVPETIHSRCQRFDFRRISTESIVSRLGAICMAEGVEFEGEALELVAHRAEGGMRNALTSLEQLIAFGEGKVTMEVAERMLGSLDSSDLAEIVRFVGMRDAAACFRWTAEFVETGADLAQFTRDFAEHIRNLYVMSLAGADAPLDVSEAARREMAGELALYGPDRLARLLGVLGDLSAELKTSTNPRLSFEIALTRMVRPDSELTLEALAERVEALERGGAGAPAMAAAATTAAPAAPPADVMARLERLEGALGGAAAASPVASSAPVGEGFASQQAASHAIRQQQPRVAVEQRAGASSGSAQAQAQAETLREEPRAAVATAAAGGALPEQVLGNLRNAAALQRCWQQAMAQLKKAKAAYGVLFLNTKAVFEEASSTLAIDFPAENDFAFRAVQKPDVQDELARAIAQAFGCSLPFRLTKGGSSVGGASAASASSAASPAVSRAVRPKQVQPQAQPQQSPRSEARPQAARPNASAPASDPVPYDEVPLDAYDDVVPYDDDPYGSCGEPAPAASCSSAQQPAQALAPEPAQAARPQASSPEPARGAAAPSVQPAASSAESSYDAVSSATSLPGPAEPGVEPTLSELDAMLAFGFGEGVEFREV